MCDWQYREPMETDLETMMKQYGNEPAICAYLQEIARFQPLTVDVQEELAKQALTGDQEARERLLESNLGMVAVIAADYMGQGLLLLDLISAGNDGLMKALEHFDPEAGQAFALYAQGCIHNAISYELATINITPRIPTPLLNRINAIVRCREKLKTELGREPDVTEIAQAMDLTEEQIRTAIHLEELPLSLDAPVSREDDTPLGDQIPTPEPMSPEVAQKVQELLESMSPREAEIIRMRFGLVDGQTHTLNEVAAAFGITRERVRQIENKAIRRRGYKLKRRKKISEFYS